MNDFMHVFFDVPEARESLKRRRGIQANPELFRESYATNAAAFSNPRAAVLQAVQPAADLPNPATPPGQQ